MTFCSDNQQHIQARVRSFVTRRGRVTVGQQRALERWWPEFGLDAQDRVDLSRLFPGCERLVVELGFGMGDSLIELAQAQPQHGFIGIEVHTPGIGRLMSLAAAASLRNLRILHGDGVEILSQAFAPGTIDSLLIFFPDPWPKKRHHKRRLINPANAALFAECLGANGTLELATDWEPYAEQMLTVLDAEPRLRNLAGAGHYAQRPASRPVTKFERRGERLGHRTHDLIYQRVEHPR